MTTAASAAHAVVVRGRVVDPLGKPVPGARVQLVLRGKVSATAVAGADGSFEIRSMDRGRFTLLSSAGGFLPAVGEDFYGGATDVVGKDVVLATNTMRQEVSVTATGLPTPLAQLTVPVAVTAARELETRVGVVSELRQTPGAFVVQTGQWGGVTSLFVRGGPSDSNKVLVDGVSANDVGGIFDFGTVSSTAVNGFEVYRGPDSAMYGSDAAASAVSFETPRGSGERPVLNYSGDAGTLHSWRNEAALSGGHRKLDYFAAGSRFDTSNALPHDRFHAVTAAGNIGYGVAPRTLLRGTIRNAVSAAGLPGAYDFLGLTVKGKQADHDLYTQGTLENTTAGEWHNLLRYGVARKNETAKYFEAVGTPISVFGFTEYFGNAVTIRGANGYTATGRASIFNADDTASSHRNELYFQSDKPLTHHLNALFGFRYEEERGVFVIPSYFEDHRVDRRNFEYTLQLQGDVKNRFFYSVGGALEKNHLYGVEGTPRVGLAWVPIAPADGWLRGTKVRASFAKGVREPSLSDEFASLYSQLNSTGNAAAIAAYHVTPLNATRSRTFDAGVDQSIFGEKVMLKAGYFHSQFDHQIDFIDSNTLKTVFGIKSGLALVYGAELNSQAYRAQGLESEVDVRFGSHWLARAGYTYLDAVIERSFSTDAAYNGTATTNPNLPGVAIGSTYPLVGARPFRRAPHTGFFAAEYQRTKFEASVKGAFASRSDDSTFLSYSDVNGDNTLLLPNRNLDFGYTKIDVGGQYHVTSRLGLFAQVDNLLNQQHLGPIGFPALPLTARAGLKVRLGGE